MRDVPSLRRHALGHVEEARRRAHVAAERAEPLLADLVGAWRIAERAVDDGAHSLRRVNAAVARLDSVVEPKLSLKVSYSGFFQKKKSDFF